MSNYVKTMWENDVTPLSAENLNKIENGIMSCCSEVNLLQSNQKKIGKLTKTDTIFQWAVDNTEAQAICVFDSLPSDAPTAHGGFITVRTIQNTIQDGDSYYDKYYKMVTYESFTTGEILRRPLYCDQWDNRWNTNCWFAYENMNSTSLVKISNDKVNKHENYHEIFKLGDGYYQVANGLVFATFWIDILKDVTGNFKKTILMAGSVPNSSCIVYQNVTSRKKVPIVAYISFSGELRFESFGDLTQGDIINFSVCYPKNPLVSFDTPTISSNIEDIEYLENK